MTASDRVLVFFRDPEGKHGVVAGQRNAQGAIVAPVPRGAVATGIMRDGDTKQQSCLTVDRIRGAGKINGLKKIG